MKGTGLISLISMLTLPAAAAADPPKIAKHAYVGVSTEFRVAAPPAKVWEAMSSSPGYMALSGEEVLKKDATFRKVGDSSPVKVSGDSGTLVVVKAVEGKELRMVFEPDQGHYTCLCRASLSPDGTGTKVMYSVWYSDEKPAAVDATAKSAADDMQKRVEKFTASLGKK